MLGFVDERIEVKEDAENISICVTVSTEDFESPVNVMLEFTGIKAQGMREKKFYF